MAFLYMKSGPQPILTCLETPAQVREMVARAEMRAMYPPTPRRLLPEHRQWEVEQEEHVYEEDRYTRKAVTGCFEEGWIAVTMERHETDGGEPARVLNTVQEVVTWRTSEIIGVG